MPHKSIPQAPLRCDPRIILTLEVVPARAASPPDASELLSDFYVSY